MRKTSYDFELLVDKLIRLLRFHQIQKDIPRGKFVVDLGCGYQGTFLNSIKDRIKEGIGYDLSVAEIHSGKIKLETLNLRNKIPLKNNSVDVVTALAVLEHIEDSKFLLKEGYRILKPGGVLILTTPSLFSKPILEFLAFRLNIISKEEIADHKRYYNIKSLKKDLISAGFNPSRINLSYFELGANIYGCIKK